MSGQAKLNVSILVVVVAAAALMLGRIAAKRQAPVSAATQAATPQTQEKKHVTGDTYIDGKLLLDYRGSGTQYDVPTNVINAKKIEVFKPEGQTEADRQISKAIAAEKPFLVCFYDNSKASSRVMSLLGEVSESLPGMFDSVKVDMSTPEGKEVADRVQGVTAAPTIVALTQKGQIKTRLIGSVEKSQIVEAFSKVVGCSDICEPGECE